MFELHPEVGVCQLAKHEEELCGDTVEVVKTATHTIIVISDGLGSGVKANILATLTTKIAASMLKRGIALPDVVETVAQTLPVCKHRKIAYSTMQIIKIANDGATTIVEFDCPRSMLIRNNCVVPFPVEDKMVAGKLIKVGTLILQEKDILVAVSDGVIHAGIGGLLKLGWGWKGLAQHLNKESLIMQHSKTIGAEIINICDGYYIGRPGDDCTTVVVKMRKPIRITLLTGPPIDSSSDEKIVKRFINREGRKIVAGGTTATIVSRIIGKQLVVDLEYPVRDLPPIGYIDGIDLVTEGVLTLNVVADNLHNKKFSGVSRKYNDGASLLTEMLLEADIIDIIAGGAVNPAHQNPKFPAEINLKAHVLAKLKSGLETHGKQVTLECC